jgi:HEAT repeat protein
MTRLLSFAMAACLIFPGLLCADETDDVDSLIRDLRAIKVDKRVHAAQALGRLGPAAGPGVRGLVSALADPSFAVQVEALIALQHIGPAARDAVPGLVLVLRGKDTRLFSGAIDTLGAIGHDSRAAVPRLLEFVKGDSQQLATSACLALLTILPPGSDELQRLIPALVKALKSKSSEVREQAVVALGHAGRLALPALIKLVDSYSTDGDSAWQAAAALEIMGRPAQPAVAVLVKALHAKNEQVVVHAAGALGAIGAGAIGSGAEAAVPQLQKLLAEGSASIRTHVASSLGDIGPGAADAVGALAQALEDRDEGVRRESAEALGKIGHAAKSAVPTLLNALGDEKASVTMHAAWALGRIGGEAVPQLIETLKDARRQYAVVVILGDIGPAAEPAVAQLAALLSEPKLGPDLGREILLALAHIGPAAREAVPALLKILDDEESQLRASAAWALAKIGAREAVPILIKALPKRDNSQLSIVAPMALLLLNRDNEALTRIVLPRVAELLGHDSAQIKSEAAAALAALGEKAAPAIPDLDAGLQDADPSVRVAFLSALAALGPASVVALPNIEKMLADPVLSVRYAASHAIGKIGPPAIAAVPRLEKNLNERDEFLQFVSAWALVQVDPEREDLAAICLGPLVHNLNHHDPHVRNEAVLALSLLGPEAKSAVQALEAIAADPDETVRKSVADALKEIAK